MKMEEVKNQKEEVRYRSKVSKGYRVIIPKDIVDIYQVKEGNMVEWIFDEEGNIQIKIKEIILKNKKEKKSK